MYKALRGKPCITLPGVHSKQASMIRDQTTSHRCKMPFGNVSVYAAPSLWNYLHTPVKRTPSTESIKNSLKTYSKTCL